jgi:GT2 family glycosyltransferase
VNQPTGAEVAVVIVAYNSGAYLSRCLTSLAQQRFRSFRTIVVDNASSDGSTGGIEARYPGVAVIRAPGNLGFAAGNNLGLAAARDAKWIALLNPDAFARADWLDKLMAAARSHPEFSFFGCRMHLADDPALLDGTGDVYHVSGASWRRDHAVPADRGAQTPGEIFGPCAAAALYSRSALEEVGGFDESYFCYHVDVDLAFRLRLRGHRCLYVPDAVVDHVSSGIAGRRSDFATYHGHRNLVWTFVKNMPGTLLWRYLLQHLLLNLVSIVVCARRGQLAVILRAKRDALMGLGSAIARRRGIQASRVVRPRELLAGMARGLGALWSRGAARSR